MVNLSHPSHHTKVLLWLSSNFPPSKSLIQSKCDDINHIVKERVKHMVDFVDDDDEEQCEDEKESTATHEEDAHPTFNDGVFSIVEAEDECEPLKALQVLSIETKSNEIAKVNEYLRNEQEREENIECEKRLKCEMQKPRESSGGECESKQPREKNYKHVRKKSCLLDSKINLGRALNYPILFAIGEENDPYFTNSYDMSFPFDDFMRQELEGLECEPRVVDAPSNFLPVMSSWKQCQVESPLAQGSSILTLTCANDSPTRLVKHVSEVLVGSTRMLNGKVFRKYALSHVYHNLCEDHEFLSSKVEYVNVRGLEMIIYLDRFSTCDLFDMWHDDLSSLITKPSLTCYDDPFLENRSCDKHAMPLMDTCLNMRMILVYAKMTKHNVFVDRRIIAKIYKIVFEFVSLHDRFYCCMTIKPFNGVGMFYGYFVKDLTTNGFVLNCFVKELLDFCAPISYAYILDSLEYDHGKCLDGMHICVRRKLGNHTIAYEIEFTCALWLGCKSYAPYLMQASLFEHSLLIPSGRIFPLLLLLYDHDDGMIDEAMYSLDVLHEVMCKLDYIDLNTFGKPSPSSRTMIFDLDSLGFTGMLDRDLKTNPSKEEGMMRIRVS